MSARGGDDARAISHALIFAAGRGERMRPLTDTTPKPLLRVGGKHLIEYHLERLAAAHVRDVVINTSHLAAQFAEALGDGARWGLRIHYAYEGPEALETGGGMLNALPLLGPAPFIAVNGDIFCDFDFATLPSDPAGLAHLVVVANPPQHARGDFVLRDGLLHDDQTRNDDEPRVTFAGIGIYRAELLDGRSPGRFGITPLLRAAMRQGRIGGEYYRGRWADIGTPGRLDELEASFVIK
jgi:MurNAc alpha-1-phosphate uridylyltransferase